MQKLTTQQALALLPLVLDGEVGSDDIKAFHSYLETDDEMNALYQSELRLKDVLRTMYKREKAPKALRDKINRLIEKEADALQQMTIEQDLPSIHQISGDRKSDEPQSNTKNGEVKVFRWLRPAAAIAAIFILTLLVVQLFQNASSPIDFYSVEEYASTHFLNHGGQILPPSFESAGLSDAAEYLQTHYDMPLRMPLIEGASFAGVAYAEFVPEYETPVISYHQKEIDEVIYVFAFKIDDLEASGILQRNPDAVETCVTYDDFHVIDMKGKHVVSWKWGDYWYAAVSNHNGNDLAALVKPMNNEWRNQW
jgi:hypothetical protein